MLSPHRSFASPSAVFSAPRLKEKRNTAQLVDLRKSLFDAIENPLAPSSPSHHLQHDQESGGREAAEGHENPTTATEDVVDASSIPLYGDSGESQPARKWNLFSHKQK